MNDTIQRLYDFAFGLFAGDDVTYEEVYISIRRAVLTVTGIMEEVANE